MAKRNMVQWSKTCWLCVRQTQNTSDSITFIVPLICSASTAGIIRGEKLNRAKSYRRQRNRLHLRTGYSESEFQVDSLQQNWINLYPLLIMILCRSSKSVLFYIQGIRYSGSLKDDIGKIGVRMTVRTFRLRTFWALHCSHYFIQLI